MVSFYPHGEMSERFKEPVLKTGDGATHRGFESHSLRHDTGHLAGFFWVQPGVRFSFGFPRPGPLNPPLRGDLPQSDGASRLIIHHDLNVLVGLRHELHHQLPAGAAGSPAGAIRQKRQHFVDFLFPIGQHIENCISLGTDSKG